MAKKVKRDADAPMAADPAPAAEGAAAAPAEGDALEAGSGTAEPGPGAAACGDGEAGAAGCPDDDAAAAAGDPGGTGAAEGSVGDAIERALNTPMDEESPLWRASRAAAYAVYQASFYAGLDAHSSLRRREPREFGDDIGLHAGTFIVANRDAPAEAIPIDLALAGKGGSLHPGLEDVFLWDIFRDVFLAVHDWIKAGRLAAEQAAAAPDPAGGWGEPARAFEPSPAPFAATGFSPR